MKKRIVWNNETLRQDYNAALDGLAGTMRTIGENSTGVNAGSAEIMQATDDLSRPPIRLSRAISRLSRPPIEVSPAIAR